MDSFGTRGVMKEPELILPIYRADPRYLEASFAELETGWGSLEGFLADGLGLDSAVLDGLRANLLEG